MFLSCTSKMSVQIAHFTLNFHSFQWAVCVVTIETKQSKNMKALCHRIVEELAEGRGVIPRSSCCSSTRHSPPHKSVLDRNTSVVHIWSIASAQPTPCQLQPDDLTSLDISSPHCGVDECMHTHPLAVNSFYVYVGGGAKEYRVGGGTEAHTQRHAVL